MAIKNLDAVKIISLLHELDRQIHEHCQIIICGGAAAIIGYGLKRFTGDIDTFEPAPKFPEFYRIIKRIEDDHGLDSGWFNEGAKGFVGYLSPHFRNRLISINEDFANLKVYVISKPDFVTMKICAWREADQQDVASIGITKDDLEIIDENIFHMQRHCPNKAYKAQQVLAELGFKKQTLMTAAKVSNLSELIQFFTQQTGKDPTLEEIREWKNKMADGTNPADLSFALNKT